MQRRDFLASMAGLGLAACGTSQGHTLPPGVFEGQDPALGHRIRDGQLPSPSQQESVKLLIVGGGVAGLSCAWWLSRHGMHDYQLLDMEGQLGGNARSGSNAVSAYPLGAHYLPLPNPESRSVRQLLADLGVLEGSIDVAAPTYNERYLCQRPQERLFFQGRWQEGLLPKTGVHERHLAQYERFEALVQELRDARDASGRRAFSLPMEQSSPDPVWRRLDQITMRTWLLDHQLDSEYLHWYVNYACRDDFGMQIDQVSAWAGLHYFAARDGAASNAQRGTFLTWPEGNGWLTQQMAQRLTGQLRTHQAVIRLEAQAHQVQVDVFDAARNLTRRITAQRVVWAAPLFVLPRVWAAAPAELRHAIGQLSYAPWLVANLTLSAPPEERRDDVLAWDNVLYDSVSLGYVVATHQHLRVRPGPTVFTYYRALAELSPALGRRTLLSRSRDSWAREILGDLSRAHPDLPAKVQQLNVTRWGHAMVRPVPGLLWGDTRQQLLRPHGRLSLAHSDLSGLSLFEEAHYRGVTAARGILEQG